MRSLPVAGCIEKLRAQCLCRPVRLNFTRFATEQNFDWVYILQLNPGGFQSVLHKVSGKSSEVNLTLGLRSHPDPSLTGFTAQSKSFRAASGYHSVTSASYRTFYAEADIRLATWISLGLHELPAKVSRIVIVQVSSSITVPSSRAVVAFLSDGANQNNGFEVSWDQGLFCDPMTTMNTSAGSFSDGTPLGQRYR